MEERLQKLLAQAGRCYMCIRDSRKAGSIMTILNCECGNEIFIMDETEATAWQCEQCGQWYDFFGVKVPDPASVQPKKSPHLVNWSAGEDL